MKNQTYEIQNNKKESLCLLECEKVFEINDDSIYQKWFSSNNLEHPGIVKLKSRGDYFISGKNYEIFLQKNNY